MKLKSVVLAAFLVASVVGLSAALARGTEGHNASAANPTPTVIATVSVGSWPYGVAVNPNTNRVYVSNHNDNTVSVINGTSNTEIDTDGNSGNGMTRVGTSQGPAGVGVNPSSNLVYTANTQGDNVSVINGSYGVTPVSVGGEYSGPLSVAVNPNTNRIFVVDHYLDAVSVIDGTANPPVEIDTDGDPGNGLTRISVGHGPWFAGIDPGTNRVYVPNNIGGGLSVIQGSGDTYTIISTLGIGNGPNHAAVNAITQRVYVSNYGDGTVSVINGAANPPVELGRITVGGNPEGVAVNPSTNRVYVTNASNSSVSVIDGASNAVVATVNVGAASGDVAVNPVTGRIYVLLPSSSAVAVIQDYPSAVGGIAEYQPEDVSKGGGASALNTLALAGTAAGAVLLLTAGGWYARRRWRT